MEADVKKQAAFLRRRGDIEFPVVGRRTKITINSLEFPGVHVNGHVRGIVTDRDAHLEICGVVPLLLEDGLPVWMLFGLRFYPDGRSYHLDVTNGGWFLRATPSGEENENEG